MPKIIIEEVPEMKSGGWIKGAVNPKHKGYCTPMSKSTCTPRRKAFAKRAKKHFKEEGGPVEDYKIGGLVPMTNHTVGNYNPHWFKNQGSRTDDINPTSEVDITHTVKPVDEENATIEAEKGELIVKPGLTGIYKILGKTHKQGGTPLAPEPGSFIFSNDPTLAIKKKDKEVFEFDEKGSNAKNKNTPAKVLEKEIDIKEYNRYISVLQDGKADKISKATAAIMIEKYQKKMGQVAYLQEARKKSEIPDFAMGSAPMYNPEIERQEDEQEMYQQGGFTQPKLYPGAKLPRNRYAPKNINNRYDYPMGEPIEKDPTDLASQWLKVGIDIKNQPANVAQKMMYDWAVKNNPDLLRNEIWGKFGLTNMGRDNIAKVKALGIGLTKRVTKGAPKGILDFADASKLTDEQIAALGDLAYNDNMFGVRQFAPSLPDVGIRWNPKDVPEIGGPDEPATEVRQPAPVPGEVPKAPQNEFNAIPTLPYDIQGKLTPAQKANLSYLGLQAMGIKKYMPMREQVDLPNVRLDRMSAQPFMNAIENQQFQGYNGANAVDPRNAKLMGSNILGKGLDAKYQALGNVAQQNIGIGNQENQINTQQQTQQIIRNAGLSHQYYDQTVQANQNYDNEKRFAKNQVASTLNQYQSEADALAWQLASVSKWGQRKVTDPKTGQVYNMPTPLYQPTSNGIRYNADVASLNMVSGADKVNNFQAYSAVIEDLKAQGFKTNEISLILSNLIKTKQPIYNQVPGYPGQQ